MIETAGGRTTSRYGLQLAAGALAAALIVSCAPSAKSDGAAAVPPTVGNLFVNGDFDSGTLAGWTVATRVNPGITIPPTSIADLRLGAGGTNLTRVITDASHTTIPYGLTAASTLRVPRYGAGVAVVNEAGASNNVNVLSQTMTTSNADVDPTDNKVHVRFAIAPVLENPGHGDADQPYFWVQLRNVTRNAVLFSTFNFANQPGVPWKTDNGVQYTDWQAFDISPGPAQLAVGDQVEIMVIAAGCSAGGHWGQVYVDAFGPTLPGLSVTAVAAQQVNSGAPLTYTFQYKNSGQGAATNTVVVANLPAGTTFASLSAPGASCTTPAVGATGAVTCNLGTVNPSASGSFGVTVNVTAAPGSTVSNGNYNVSSDGVAPLIGPLVTTAVTSNVQYADLAASISDGVAALGWGTSSTYTLVVRNDGPAAAHNATLSLPVPANFGDVTWTCGNAAGGALCPNASGAGAISETIATFPAGGSLTYTVTGDVSAGAGSGTVVQMATVTAPAGVSDNDSTNNTAVDTDAVGTLYTLALSKAGRGQGTIVSSPAALHCGATCTASFLSGTVVYLTATASAGNTFDGWSGGGCSGSQSVCSTTVSAATAVTATFNPVQWTVTGSTAGAGSGTISCTSPVDDATPSSCTITPAARSFLSALTDNGAGVLGSVSGGAAGGTYTIASVTANHTVSATFGASVSTTTLSVSPATPVFGQPVTLTATLTGVSPAGTPGGTVTFRDAGAPIGGCTDVAVSAGRATCTVSSLSVSTHGLTATSSGDGTWNGDATDAATSLTVGRASTSLSLTDDPAGASLNGVAVTLTATATATLPGGGTPGGTVAFLDGGVTIAGCGAVPLSGGQASCTTAAVLGAGTHGFRAVYAGNGSYDGSQAERAHDVLRVAPTLTVSSSASPSRRGQSVTLTATLTSDLGTPTGTVSVLDGSTPLCGSVALSSGRATCTVATLPVGLHALAIAYGGDDGFLPAEGSFTQDVQKAGTAVTLASTPAPAMYGQAVTLTATVTTTAPGAGTASGSVVFHDGSSILGTAALVAGAASIDVPRLAAGDHLVTATYAGDASFEASAGEGQVSIERGTTTVSVASSRQPSRAGRPITWTATVTSPHATPEGTVVFRDGDVTLGSAPLSGGQGSITVRSLRKGTHDLQVTFEPDAGFAEASGSLQQVVENTPPVASSGTALELGAGRATSASAAVSGGALDGVNTIELWARASWTAPEDVTAPTLLRLAGPGGDRFTLSASPDRSELRVTIGGATTAIPAALDDGAWHQLAIVAVDGALRVDVDGAEAGTVPGGLGEGAISAVALGEGFTGSLDEVRLWSTARSLTELAANARRPLHGGEEGLRALWRLDEGSGTEAFDATPSALDLAVALDGEGASAFTASEAWRARAAKQERPMALIEAGYDADGDPMALTLTAPPAHGTATIDDAALQIAYVPAARHLGLDALAYQLDDGTATSDASIDIEVHRILVCRVTADCGGGDLCVTGSCETRTDVDVRSGGGCSSGGASGLGGLLFVVALLGSRRWRRRGVLAAALLAAGVASAGEPDGFALQTFEPSPAGDRFLTVSDPRVEGHLQPSVAVALSVARDPLVLELDGEVVPDGTIVRQQPWAFALVSLPLFDTVLVDASFPVAFGQSGQRPLPDLARVSSTAAGDLRLGARAALPDLGPVHLAAAMDLWVPTGSREGFSSDGAARALPKVIAGGSMGPLPIEWGAEAGVLLRRGRDLTYARTGAALAVKAGVAWTAGGLRIGPELYGRVQFEGSHASPLEGLLGASYRWRGVDVGAAVGTAFNDAPGAAPLRGLLRIGWGTGSTRRP